MKKLVTFVGLALCLTSGFAIAAGADNGQAVYARIVSGSDASPVHATLILRGQPGSVVGRYQLHSQIIKNGRVESDRVNTGKWNVEPVALDGQSTFYVLTPDQGGATRFALRTGDDDLLILGKDQNFARIDNGYRLSPAR